MEPGKSHLTTWLFSRGKYLAPAYKSHNKENINGFQFTKSEFRQALRFHPK